MPFFFFFYILITETTYLFSKSYANWRPDVYDKLNELIWAELCLAITKNHNQ